MGNTQQTQSQVFLHNLALSITIIKERALTAKVPFSPLQCIAQSSAFECVYTHTLHVWEDIFILSRNCKDLISWRPLKRRRENSRICALEWRSQLGLGFKGR
jgi:hypothetical protein